MSVSALRLYIWEGNGISSAYHDDGTLVVLAESPDAARLVVAKARTDYEAALAAMKVNPDAVAAYDEYRAYLSRTPNGTDRWQTPEGKAVIAKRDRYVVPRPLTPDGDAGSMAREPDRVVELTAPAIVAFNGGGYD